MDKASVNQKVLDKLHFIANFQVYNRMFNKSGTNEKVTEQGKYCLILDLRPRKEFEAKQISNISVNLPFDELDYTAFSEANLKEQVRKVKNERTKEKLTSFKRYFIVILASDSVTEKDNFLKFEEECAKKAVLLYSWLLKNKCREIGIAYEGMNKFDLRYPFLVSREEKDCQYSDIYDFPSEIFEECLFVGNELHATEEKVVKSLGITHILNITMHVANKFEGEVKYLKIALNDTCKDESREYFPKAFEFIDSAFGGEELGEEQNVTEILEDDFSDEQKVVEVFNQVFSKCYGGKSTNRVLIHCSLGVSRSATFTIMYIMKKFKTPYEETKDFVKSLRTLTIPNDTFEEELEALEENDYEFN